MLFVLFIKLIELTPPPHHKPTPNPFSVLCVIPHTHIAHLLHSCTSSLTHTAIAPHDNRESLRPPVKCSLPFCVSANAMLTTPLSRDVCAADHTHTPLTQTRRSRGELCRGQTESRAQPSLQQRNETTKPPTAHSSQQADVCVCANVFDRIKYLILVFFGYFDL